MIAKGQWLVGHWWGFSWWGAVREVNAWNDIWLFANNENEYFNSNFWLFAFSFRYDTFAQTNASINISQIIFSRYLFFLYHHFCLHDTMQISYKISNVLLKKISDNCYKKLGYKRLGRAITFKNVVARLAIRIFWRISRPATPVQYNPIGIINKLVI